MERRMHADKPTRQIGNATRQKGNYAMDEEEKKIYIHEMNEIIKSRHNFITRNYARVRDAYKNHYDWPELDPLRHEICLCIIFGLDQAAMALTNNMLENLLKIAIIEQEGLSQAKKQSGLKEHSIESFTSAFRPARKKYGQDNLGNNINRACSLGLITKDEKKELDKIRDRIRNAYSHADKEKTFGDQKIPGQYVHLENDKMIIGQPENINLVDLIAVYGIAQKMHATQNAIPYFLYIDNHVREIKIRLFGPKS